MEQGKLFEAESIVDNLKSRNPMLKWGAGPKGRKCKDCIEIFKVTYSKKYYKCKRRGESRSSSTDHRINWQCCIYFVEAADE